MRLSLLVALAACSPSPPPWAQHTGTLPPAVVELSLDAAGQLWLDGQPVPSSGDEILSPELLDATRERLLIPGPTEARRARVWLDPSRSFGEARGVLSTLNMAGACVFDIQAAPGAGIGWSVPSPCTYEGEDPPEAPPPMLVVHLKAGAAMVGQIMPLIVPIPVAADGAGERAELDGLLRGLIGPARPQMTVLVVDDDQPVSRFLQSLDTMVGALSEAPLLGGGSPEAPRAELAIPTPTPPERVEVPKRVVVSPGGRLQVETDRGVGELLIWQVQRYWERCADSSCVVIAEPDLGPALMIGERPPASGLGRSWIFGRPVLAWPSDRALPAARPALEGTLDPLALIDGEVHQLWLSWVGPDWMSGLTRSSTEEALRSTLEGQRGLVETCVGDPPLPVRLTLGAMNIGRGLRFWVADGGGLSTEAAACVREGLSFVRGESGEEQVDVRVRMSVLPGGGGG